MRAVLFSLACCLWLVQLASAAPFALGQKQETFLPVDQAFSLRVERPASGGVVLRWDIAPGYYLYQERLRFGGLAAGNEPQLPPGEPYHDEYFGDSQVYRNSLEVTLAMHRADKEPEEADFIAQANQAGAGDQSEKRELTTTETAPFRGGLGCCVLCDLRDVSSTISGAGPFG